MTLTETENIKRDLLNKFPHVLSNSMLVIEKNYIHLYPKYLADNYKIKCQNKNNLDKFIMYLENYITFEYQSNVKIVIIDISNPTLLLTFLLCVNLGSV